MNYNEPHGRCPHGEVATGPGYCVMCPACLAGDALSPEVIEVEYPIGITLDSSNSYTCLLCAARAPKELWGPGRVRCPQCGQLQPSPYELELMRPGFPARVMIAADDVCDCCGETGRSGVVFKGKGGPELRPVVCCECLERGRDLMHLRAMTFGGKITTANLMAKLGLGEGGEEVKP